MHLFSETYQMMPGQWESQIGLSLLAQSDEIIEGAEHHFVLRMLTEGKPVDFPFRLIPRRPNAIH